MEEYKTDAPVMRPVWKAHKIIGYVSLSRKDADFLNGTHGIGVYFGYTEIEHRILNYGTEDDLRKAGFIK